MSTYNIDNVSGTGNILGDRNVVNGPSGPLADLERILAEHRAMLRDPHAAAEAMRSLRTECETTSPRRRRVSELLEAITTNAGGAIAVAQAVEGVRAILS